MVSTSIKRVQKKDATPGGIVVVGFRSKQDKQTVFKARSKLKDTRIGMDDDLTRLQQERKNAAWPAFMEARASGVRTQWRAEKLFILKEGHFVEHKVLDL